MSASCELTILMPCLNEAETLAACIAQGARRSSSAAASRGEVRDRRQRQHRRLAARSPRAPARASSHVPRTRLRRARCIGGIAAARGRYVIMGDADDSYDFAAPRCRSSSSCATATTW